MDLRPILFVIVAVLFATVIWTEVLGGNISWEQDTSTPQQTVEASAFQNQAIILVKCDDRIVERSIAPLYLTTDQSGHPVLEIHAIPTQQGGVDGENCLLQPGGKVTAPLLPETALPSK